MNKPIPDVTPEIFDCTLRDGSYVVDFQFTAQDTWLIASALEQAGIRYIEIGHGLGWSASQKGHGVALETDEDYCKAVSGKLTRAKWGTFFIPGIGTMEDISRAADLGANFIRVGTDVTRAVDGSPYIKHAKSLGLMVFSNFMKTYSVTPEELVTHSRPAVESGADVLVVVDSAGGMLPEDVSAYVQALRGNYPQAIGFHGHNNLDLAMVNSLSAMESGAAFIDCSLQGLGRSTGNTMTEVLALLMKRKQLGPAYDVNTLMDIGEKFVLPLLQPDRFNGISMTSGYARFHSSFMSRVNKYAFKHKVDPRTLIVRLCEESQTEAPEELLDGLAAAIRQDKENITTYQMVLNDVYVNRTEELVKKAVSLAHKQRRKLVYNLVYSKRSIPISANIQNNADYVLLNGQGKDLTDFEEVFRLLKHYGKPLFLVDQRFSDLPESLAPLIRYNDQAVWADALLNDLNTSFPGQVVLFSGDHWVRELLEKRNDEFLFTVSERDASVLVSFDAHAARSITDIREFDCYYDAVVGGLSGLEEILGNHTAIRVNMAPALFSFLAKQDTYRNLGDCRGRRHLDGGTDIISGGLIGRKGDIVVDNIHEPQFVIGVADGRGGLEAQLSDYQEALDKTQSFIVSSGLSS